MGFQKQNEGQNSPEMRRKYARCMEFLPQCEIRHPKWLTAIQSMHNMDMEHEDRSKTALRQAFLQLMTWPKASKDRAKMAYKNGPKHAIMKQLTATNPKWVRALQQH